MHQHDSKRKKTVKLIAVYTGMTLITLVIVACIVLIVLGFRFDTNKQSLEQYAFLQFNSAPTGSMVAIDGNRVNNVTPNKTSVPEGTHEVVIWRDGYETWRKTLDVKKGTLTWLNYALMVPKKLTVEPMVSYDNLSTSIASLAGKYIAIQQSADKPVFDIVQIDNDSVISSQINIPKKDYSEAYTTSMKHNFKIVKWDTGERYLLIQHTYNDSIEWLVVDSQDANNTKNVTKLFNLSFTDLDFSGTSGNILFGLESGNIRKLDIKSETVSKLLVTNVKQFSLYGQDIITYISDGDKGTRLVGLYRDSDQASFVLRTINADDKSAIKVISTHYFNEDYVAIVDNNKVYILSGNYSGSLFNNASDMKSVNEFSVTSDVQEISFSPSGQYLMTQSGANFTSYDLEYKKIVSSTVDNTGSASPLKWLNGSYVWSDNGNNLNIREFDGANPRVINPVITGQEAVITKNGKYIYSLNKSANGYQLQRVLMVLP